MLSFQYDIPTSLSADALWGLLCDSFQDSDAHGLWPHHLESLRCAQLHQGAVVKASYKFGPLTMHQRYDIPRFDEASHQLSYATRAMHPLDGGGQVSVRAYGSGSVLHWRGSYKLKPRPDAIIAALYTKLYFEPRFFEAIKHNLRDQEQRLQRAS